MYSKTRPEVEKTAVFVAAWCLVCDDLFVNKVAGILADSVLLHRR